MSKIILKNLLHILPNEIISRSFGTLADIQLPAKIQSVLNSGFAKIARIDVNEFDTPVKNFNSLNALFTRKLNHNARPFPNNPNAFASPADGRLDAFGTIQNETIIEAKNQNYNIEKLLGCNTDFEHFNGGSFCVIYLSPRNYHRVHVPFEGYIKKMSYVQGKLFPVNKLGITHIDDLFVRNERLTSFIEDENNRRAAIVMVGATCVGKISVVYDNFTTNKKNHESFCKELAEPYHVENGDELGVFNLGSTVVLLLEKDRFQLNPQLQLKQQIKTGQELGTRI